MNRGIIHPFSQAPQAGNVGSDAVLSGEPSHDDHECSRDPTVCESSASEPPTVTGPVHYPWGFVSSQLMDSKGEEITYRVDNDRDRIWARRLEWVVDQHLDRAEDELNQLQADFEAVLRQSKEARERKFDQAHIADLYRQLETAHMRLRALR